MSNKINTYYVYEDQYTNPGKWEFVLQYSRLRDAEAEAGFGDDRIVRYAGKKPPEVVRQWDAEGKRVV